MLTPAMTYSKSGIALTERFEGCRLEPYEDQGGVWTIGYGHTAGVAYNTAPITQARAEELLAADVQSAVNAVNRLVGIEVDQDEFDALVDFVFNLGSGDLAGSTLLKKLNAGDIPGAAAEFDRWDHCGGQVVAGLLRRRQAETDLFLANITGANS